MATILIPTIPGDLHAAAVAHVLQRMGHRAIRWFCGDLPQRSTMSYSIAGGTASLQAAGPLGRLAIEGAHVLWNRRIGAPSIKEPMPASDRAVALRESAMFSNGVLALLSDGTFAVNGAREAADAENKLTQLRVAREVGLTLPDTLISNDPQRIRSFVRGHRSSGTVFKAFRPVTWESADRLAMLYTAKVDEAMLPDDRLLQLSPGLFQAYVPKACEIRVTCMGDELVAARLDSQGTRDGKVDWRIAPLQELGVTRIELPADVQARCRALMKRLGLVFGCIDLIVTPAGQHVFLEINQMGQFLWVEDMCGEIPLLQMFCEFLVARDPGYRHQPGRHRFPFADVRPAAVEVLKAEEALHQEPDRGVHVVHE
jgi:glutathione synthase/RimK-type ligase-like ATP-grasp enzyme